MQRRCNYWKADGKSIIMYNEKWKVPVRSEDDTVTFFIYFDDDFIIIAPAFGIASTQFNTVKS